MAKRKSKKVNHRQKTLRYGKTTYYCRRTRVEMPGRKPSYRVSCSKKPRRARKGSRRASAARRYSRSQMWRSARRHGAETLWRWNAGVAKRMADQGGPVVFGPGF